MQLIILLLSYIGIVWFYGYNGNSMYYANRPYLYTYIIIITEHRSGLFDDMIL